MTDKLLHPFRFEHCHSLIFDLDIGKFSYTSSMEEADIIPLIDAGSLINEQISLIKPIYKKTQLILLLSLYHITEKDVSLQYRNILQKQLPGAIVEVVHTYSNIKNIGIYYDFLWERQKVYMTQYDNHDLSCRTWTQGMSKKCFALADIKPKTNPRHFLCPARIYNDAPRGELRTKLKNALHFNTSYKTDIANNIFLEPEDLSAETIRHYGIDGSEIILRGGSWCPIANHYYNKTIISVYVETLTYLNHDHGNKRSVTEKTFDPLIKGHFILPFGYCGLIEDICDYGFKLPTWIDYSYDSIENNDERFNAFLQVVNEIQATPIPTLTKLNNQDIDMLHYNRQLFYDKPNQSLYNMIEKLL
jgi:hypothetical protein